MESIFATLFMSAYLSFFVLTLSMTYEIRSSKKRLAILLICTGAWVFSRQHFSGNSRISFLLGRVLLLLSVVAFVIWRYLASTGFSAATL